MGKIWNLVGRKQNSLGSAALVLMCMVIGSAILGLIRLRILYDRFTPEETGIFFAAFRIPNLLFEILAMGTITSAFIPVFTKYITRNEIKTAHTMASVVINLTVAVLAVITIPIMIWTGQICRLFAPGFSAAEITQMVSYTRMMVLMQVIPLIIGNFFTGVLQSYNLFLIPALAPILYNLGMIIAIIFLSPVMGLNAAVVGVGIGAMLFLAVHLPLIFRIGYRHQLVTDRSAAGVAEVGKLMLPRIIGLGASQIDVTVDLILASLLGSKMVTVFYLAQSLQQLPVRLFGTTVAQAALPILSAASAREETERFKRSILSAYNMILFFILPVSVFFVVLRIPIVRLVYGASRFDWEATVLTAMTLSAFSISLFAQAIGQVFARGFYALYNSRTPVIVSVITIFINAILSICFVTIWHFPVWSLGLSASIASIANAMTLLVLLNRRVGGFDAGEILYKPLKMIFISLITGFIVYVPMKIMDQLVFDTTRVTGLVMLTFITGNLGIATYLFLSWVFDVAEVQSFFRFIEKLKKVKSFLIEQSSELVSGEVSNN